MVLLTSSTVSALTSACVVALCTLGLFLAGYAIQQQSVNSLRTQLHEEHQQEGFAYYGGSILNHRRPPDGEEGQLPRDISALEDDNHAKVPKGGHQKRWAHLQLVSRASMSELCSSLSFFQTLGSNSTVDSDRILLYPRSIEARGERLMKALSRLRDIGVFLHAVDVPNVWGRAPAESKILDAAATKLVKYDQIFYLRGPGLMLSAKDLDSYFLTKPYTPQELLSMQKALKRRGKGGKKGKARELEQIWLTSRLSTSMSQLPAAFKTSRQFKPDGRSTMRAFVPSAEVRPSFVLPSSKVSQRRLLEGKVPAYVYFDRDDGKRVRGNEEMYAKWRTSLQTVCPDVELDD